MTVPDETGDGHPAKLALLQPLDLEAQALLAELRARMFQRDAEPWIGRFRLVRSLGRGSYGSVVEAEDTQLERSIALKVMRARAEVGDDAPVRRMLREARALASLSHPNVVQVFDAGVNEGRVWIAMELVRGTTLREWKATTNEVKLDVLRQAGRGLAAAHALGILHRDFKPANVLVGDDGRVRVADFGLARPQVADHEHIVTGPSSGGEPTPLGSIAGGGMMVGTLRYMSPEQLRAERLDARSDQFNFAVTAWEVLVGAPPFRGATRDELLEAIARHDIAEPDRTAVARAVRRVLRRALSYDPSRRYPDMTALLHALARHSTPLRVGIWALGVGIVAAGAWLFSAEPKGPHCDERSARTELETVLGEPRRQRVAAAIDATGSPHASEMRTDVDAALDAFAGSWIGAHVQACRATWFDGAADERQLDARMACLRDGLATADALLDHLATPSRALVDGAGAAVHALPPPGRCAARTDDALPGDRELALRGLLARARAAMLAYDHDTALELARVIADEAGDLGLEGPRGDALEIEGLVRAQDRQSEAIASLLEAYELAVARGEDTAAGSRARALARALANARRFDEAGDWLRHAEAARLRAPPSPVAEAEHAAARCWVLHEHTTSTDCLPACESAASLARAEGVPPRLRRSSARLLAQVYGEAGRFVEAEAILRTELDLNTHELGTTHPETRILLGDLSSVAALQLHAEDAIRLEREFIAMTEAAAPDDAYTLSKHYLSLAAYLAWMGEYEEADLTLTRSLTLLAARVDADPDDLEIERCQARMQQALIWLEQGKTERALEELRDVQRIEHRLLPEDNAQVLSTALALARVLLQGDQPAAAEVEIVKALPFLRDKRHPRLPEVLVHYAWSLEEQGRMREAAEHHREAIVAAGMTSPVGVYAIGRLVALGVRSGDMKAARQWLEHATSLTPTDELIAGSPTAALEFGRALLLEARGDREGAAASARRAREILVESDPATLEIMLLRQVTAWEAERDRDRG